MTQVLTHFVQMDTYEIPDDIPNDKIEKYILENTLIPKYSKTRDWEIVEINKYI